MRVGHGSAGNCGVDVDDVLVVAAGGFMVDDLEAAQDEAERVGDDGGAARRKAAAGGEDDEVGQGGVNFLGGPELGGGGAEEVGRKVARIVERTGSFT